MEQRAQIPPSCNTYYSSCSYAGPNVLRRAIRQLTLQSVSSKAAETRLKLGVSPDTTVQQSSFRVGSRRQSDPVDTRGLPHFPEATVHVPSQPLLTVRTPRHMPAAPHIKLALPPAPATASAAVAVAGVGGGGGGGGGGRCKLPCARDAGAVNNGSRTSHIHQSVSHTGALQTVRSTYDVLVLARKRLSARIRRDDAAGNVSTSRGFGTCTTEFKEESHSIPSLTLPRHGWTEGGALLSRGEESCAEEGACGEERGESSVGKPPITQKIK